MEQNFKNVNSPAMQAETVAGENAGQLPGNGQPMEKSPYSDFENGLKEIFGDGFALDDKLSQDLLLHHLRMNKEQNEQLATAVRRDPRIGQMLSDMVEGKRNAHTAMARYFGRSAMMVNENSPEYDEIMLADEERREEIARLANDRREYEANLEESIPLIEQYCTEKGYDPSDFLGDVWETLIFPVLAGKYSHRVCELLDHAVSYERDVEDAFAAGDVKGRNTSIMRMKEDFGDGLPKGINSVAPPEEKPKRRNSLIEKALNA